MGPLPPILRWTWGWGIKHVGLPPLLDTDCRPWDDYIGALGNRFKSQPIMKSRRIVFGG
jgi:hypothetical protein